MLADSHSLLGRLQRGRGDAVREVLAIPRDLARQVLLQCLCIPDDLTTHREVTQRSVTEWAGDRSVSSCGSDLVIGAKSGWPISREFLKAMQARWFGS